MLAYDSRLVDLEHVLQRYILLVLAYGTEMSQPPNLDFVSLKYNANARGVAGWMQHVLPHVSAPWWLYSPPSLVERINKYLKCWCGLAPLKGWKDMRSMLPVYRITQIPSGSDGRLVLMSDLFSPKDQVRQATPVLLLLSSCILEPDTGMTNGI